MAVSTISSAGLTASGVTSASLDSNAQYYGFKNRIINGAMLIDQRNAGASVTATTSNLYSVDRWQTLATVNSKFTAQQNAGSVTPPAGFVNYLGITSLAATTSGATDYYILQQSIEGYNIADLNWGSANAQTVTLSFWVRSSLTGSFGVTLQNGNNNRSYPILYTISSANTWEYKTITIAGDTSGTWFTTNGNGVQIRFDLGIGSTYKGTSGAWTGTSNIYGVTGATSVVGTNGATFYITGVQLEKGSTATSFDYRPYGTELQLAQRYYRTSFPYGTAPVQNGGQQGALAMQSPSTSANTVFVTVQVSPPMRTNPGTITYYNPNAANANWRNTSSNTDGGVTGQVNGSSTGWMVFMNSTPAGAGNTYQIHYSADAEL